MTCWMKTFVIVASICTGMVHLIIQRIQISDLFLRLHPNECELFAFTFKYLFYFLVYMVMNVTVFVFSACRAKKDSVHQTESLVVGTEGESVTLVCEYETTDERSYLLWYKQQQNNIPDNLLGRGKYDTGNNGTEFSERFHSTFSSSSIPLTIRNLQVTDAAVYYCALQPTVRTTPSASTQKHI